MHNSRNKQQQSNQFNYFQAFFSSSFWYIIFLFLLSDSVEFRWKLDCCLSKSSQKPEHETDDNPQQNRKRSNSLTEQPKKIIDLDDGLEKIFKTYSLSNVESTVNEWLRPVAVNVYKRRFGQNRIFTNVETFTSGLRNFLLSDSYVPINSLKTCLQYLRCLGSTISDLMIWCKKSKKDQCEWID